MASIRLSVDLRGQCVHLFNTCDLRPDRAAEVEALMQRVLAQQARYRRAESRSGVPWCFIAAVHQMESSGRVNRHLHNGDPLNARIRQVPAVRPLKGSPPFSWEESAADALPMHRLSAASDWSLGSLRYRLERSNGFGYRRYHPEVLSPYLWSYSDHCASGKYVADGRWSDTARSAQCGAATLLRRLIERVHVAVVDQPTPAPDAAPLVVAHARRRPTAAATVEQGMRLRRWLNTFRGSS